MSIVPEEKRICIVTAFLLTGGSDNLLLSICSRLVSAGYCITLYAAYPPPAYGRYGTLQQEFEEWGIEVIRSPFWIKPVLTVAGLVLCAPALVVYPFIAGFSRDRIMAFYRRIYRRTIGKRIDRVYQYLLAIRIEINHFYRPYALVSGYHGAICYALYLIKQRLQIPVCYTEISSPLWRHNTDPDDYMGLYLNAFDGIFVPSSAIENELREYEHLTSPSRIVPFIVEPPTRSYSPSNDPAKTFGSIARLSPEKNQDLLIRLLPAVKARVPNARLILIGSGPTESMLRKIAADIGVLDAVEFISRFDRIENVIDRIDIVTLLSDVEGMPLTLLEALCYGKPILATAVGSIPDIVIDRYNGYLVDKADLPGIVDHLVEIMTDEKCYATMSENSRRLYADRFEPDMVFERLRESIDEIILQNAG